MFPASVLWDTPVILIGLLAIALGGVIARQSTFYRELVNREISSKRFHALDGLRGYLALGVVLHHTALNYQYYQHGIWGGDISHVASFIGPSSVCFFFMITAFLFWNRVIDDGGRIDAFKFYVSRVRRILPMYLVAATLVIFTSLTLTGFHLKVPVPDLMKQVFAWLLFTVPGTPDINGLPQTSLINTVFWSLVWEWKFYIALPFIAVCAYTRHRWTLAVLLVLHIWLNSTEREWFFLAGCVAAALTRHENVRKAAATPIAAFVALSFIAAAIGYLPPRNNYFSLWGAALMFVPFVVFAGGNTLFGTLTCRPARVLGLLSYSIYLLHNWVLFVISRFANQFGGVGTLSGEWYWSLGGLMALTTIACATITYRFVEYPYMRSPESASLHIRAEKVRQLYRKLLRAGAERKS